jgi:nucleoside-diphosphate-sugar epimerase
MKLLVIGGSYFLGRVFLIQAAKLHNITVVNRGTYSVEAFGVQQIKGDRKNASLWQQITDDYDAIIDFCAYEAHDISTVLKNFGKTAKQYIFISTVDVYQHDTQRKKDEQTPLESNFSSDSAGNYIRGKVLLEQELCAECRQKEMKYTILRPSIIYGPFNYAPRESAYIQLAVKNHILPHITDAEGKFQFVYVKDVANAILSCLLNENTYQNAFNLCNEIISDYNSFYEELKQVIDVPVTELKMTVSEALAQNVPLPFPLTAAETQLYANEKSINSLGMQYTPFSEGLQKTYRAFKNVFCT